MNKLRLLIEKQLKPNWITILIGWEGPGKYSRQLTPKDIIEFATELVTNEDNQPESVWILAGTSENDVTEVENLVKQLAQCETVDRGTEVRKWRVILVEDALNNLSDDPLYGLIGLTEVWGNFDYPTDSPHFVQGVNNSLSPQEYYTQDNYNHIIKLHREWIENEFKILRSI
ncbi:DUF2247 family protein [Clostridium felsineum]|uniref:DUF2247 family protein n=1 Tax=Clostridium felsineum TaxID=36839 RepID=UPI0009C9E17B|nr:DUF2247 family protein [Clostridium felsineum]URZ03170.1 hypothetical protein CLAUR_032160 [Clostridium felsineum]